MLGLQNEREWDTFCRAVLQLPDVAADPRFGDNASRSMHRDELFGVIASVFMTLSGAAVVARLDQARIANARVNDMHAVWRHPQLAARHRWRTVASPAGPLPAPAPPAMPDGWTPRMDPIPALGEHTEAILREVGLSSESIADLREAGAI
jgi:itaconate CoA-transferase